MIYSYLNTEYWIVQVCKIWLSFSFGFGFYMQLNVNFEKCIYQRDRDMMRRWNYIERYAYISLSVLYSDKMVNYSKIN